MNPLKIVSTFFSRFFVLFSIGFIHLYRYTLSPLLGATCRFQPTCSHYAIEAFQKHGFITGFLLTVKRLKKCHPLGSSGFDPVPKTLSEKK